MNVASAIARQKIKSSSAQSFGPRVLSRIGRNSSHESLLPLLIGPSPKSSPTSSLASSTRAVTSLYSPQQQQPPPLPSPLGPHQGPLLWSFNRSDYTSGRSFSTMAPTNDVKLQPIVVSGPSGTGKSTILKRLLDKYPDRFMFSVSHTSRAPRPGEKDGEHYNYVTREAFEKLISEGGFIENAQFSGNLYGTSFAAVEKVQKAGKTCLLDIEMEGVKQMHKSHLKARYLFVAPPSFEELERRLRGRATDSDDDINKRLAQARLEMDYSTTPGVHDKVVVNEDLDTAYAEVERFCLGEE